MDLFTTIIIIGILDMMIMGKTVVSILSFLRMSLDPASAGQESKSPVSVGCYNRRNSPH